MLTATAGPFFKDLSDVSTQLYRSGTISDVLKCAEQSDVSKIVQVRSIPFSSAGWTQGPYSTDYVAWRATEIFPFGKDSDHNLPIADFHFRQIATKGAHTWWDVAGRGRGRYFTVNTGGQCIWIARPKATTEHANILIPSDYDDLMGKTDMYDPDVYQETNPRNARWVVEQIFLGPGMTM